MKDAQLTLFAIIGIFIIFGVSMFFYLQNLQDAPGKAPYMGTESVKENVEICMRHLTHEYADKIGPRGGSLHIEDNRVYQGGEIGFTCLQQSGSGCVSTALLREDIEDEFAKYIESGLESCVDIRQFRALGYEIEEGKPQVKVIIGLDKVHAIADYPLVFSRNNSNTRLKDFSASIDCPLGRLYYLATSITNSEISEGYFDAVTYISENGAEIMIEKHRPYPDLVYELRKDGYNYSFALQGASSLDDMNQFGCCYIKYDNNCFKNLPRLLCEEKGGIYDPNPRCRCPSIESKNNTLCNGRECLDCPSTYDYVTEDFTLGSRQHGESWCSYDGVSGLGRDLVGSRHYLHYCVDGQEYVEECRDFREEICVQQGDIGQAECRPNRIEDCDRCLTKGCCNSTLRDCYWEDGGCKPQVPAGSRFWESSFSEVCAAASSALSCAGRTCGDQWATKAAKACYSSGDCGNYMNHAGSFTEEGFFTTDIRAVVDRKIYPNSSSTRLGNIPLSLPLARERKETIGSRTPAIDGFASIMASVYSFLSSLDQRQPEVYNVAVCSPWQAPSGGEKCDACMGDEYRPCSEYRCMSLGKECIYEEREGAGYCSRTQNTSAGRPSISFVQSDDHSASSGEIVIGRDVIDGVSIDGQLQAYDNIGLKIMTTTSTTCTMSYAPGQNSVQFGDEGYAELHTMNFRVMPRPSLPKRLFDMANTTSGYYGLIDDLMGLAGREDVAGLLQSIFGEDETERASGFISMLRSDLPENLDTMRLILDEMEQGGYYLFIRCSDRSGNSDDFFIEMKVQDGIDTSPPRIIGLAPYNASVYPNDADGMMASVFLNEPGSCRYSYNDTEYELMNDTMECERNRFRVSPEFGGSYKCIFNFSTDEAQAFIRCADNPSTIEEYTFVMQGERIAELGIDKDIIQSSSVFGLSESIVFHMDDEMNCSLSYSPGIRIDGDCRYAEGYECRFDGINATSNITANILCIQGIPEHNVNSQSYVYGLHRSDALEIIDFGPKGIIETRNPLLYVETTGSGSVECGFYEELELGAIRMDNIEDFKFSSVLRNVRPGQNKYYAFCRDGYGNEAVQEIGFYVE